VHALDGLADQGGRVERTGLHCGEGFQARQAEQFLGHSDEVIGLRADFARQGPGARVDRVADAMI
jgi:hypothetical protein